MNNVKLKGRAAKLRGVLVVGLPTVRKAKHSWRELKAIEEMKTPALKRRSKNRRRRELATQSKRRNRK